MDDPIIDAADLLRTCARFARQAADAIALAAAETRDVEQHYRLTTARRKVAAIAVEAELVMGEVKRAKKSQAEQPQ